MQSTIAGMRMSVWQWQGHSPGLQELFGILAGSFLGLAELQTPEGFQLLTLSTRTYCVFFRLLPLHAAGMHGNGATEELRRQPASQQYERLGHLPEKQFSDEHIHFLLSGRLSGKSCNKTVQPASSSHQLHPGQNSPVTQLSRGFYFHCDNDGQ